VSGCNLIPFAASASSPTRSTSLPIDKLEEAIAHLLIRERSPEAIAEAYGIERAELLRLVELYRGGGRAALARNRER
jgi:hypothetical protein